MTNYAKKMLEWGDKCVGFQQQHDVNGWAMPTASVRFYLADTHVEVAFSTTVAFGGGVQHSAEGSIVLSRANASELGAALLDVGKVYRRHTQAPPGTYEETVTITKSAAETLFHHVMAVDKQQPADYVRKLHQAEQLREMLQARPGDGADLKAWENWSRVAGKLLGDMQ